jgi:hypothetical protein
MDTRRPGVLVVLFGCLWMHTPAGGQPESALSVPGPEVHKARVLSPEQIRTMFAGSTASGEDEDGTPFDAYLSDDETLKMKHGNTSYTGNWYVNQDGKLCGSIEEFFVTDTVCFTVDADGGSPR